jgi:raffinose/stachyose/melibiose transport system permease protein
MAHPTFKKPRSRFPWHIVVFVTPALLIYTAFMIYPLLDSLRLSLFNRGLDFKPYFVGLENYQKLLTDERLSLSLWNAIRNNAIFFGIHMLLQNPIGLGLALLLHGKLRGAAVYRSLIFIPTVLSVVLVGLTWRMILSPVWGISEGFLGFFGLRELFAPWLGLESSALLTISLMSVWQNVGIPMMLFLAALVRIPEDLLEAARMDGASPWTTFWRIQFPLILPVVGIVGVLTFVGNFNAFDLVYASQGALAGPSFSTDLLGTLFYRTYFGFQLQSGNPYMGASIAGVMLLIILAGLLLYLSWQRRLEQVEY